MGAQYDATEARVRRDASLGKDGIAAERLLRSAARAYSVAMDAFVLGASTDVDLSRVEADLVVAALRFATAAPAPPRDLATGRVPCDNTSVTRRTPVPAPGTVERRRYQEEARARKVMRMLPVIEQLLPEVPAGADVVAWLRNMGREDRARVAVCAGILPASDETWALFVEAVAGRIAGRTA